MVGISQLSQMLKSLYSDTNYGHALNSLRVILHTTSSKLNALLRVRKGKIFPFWYQRWPWTKQPSWNSSTNIFFQTIYPLEQKLDRRLLANGDSEITLIIWFAYQRLPSTKQPSWNSSTNIFFQTIYPLEQKFDRRLLANRDSEITLIIWFAYQRLPSTKQPFWNSSTNIFFQTICPLEQKLTGRLHATWRL